MFYLAIVNKVLYCIVLYCKYDVTVSLGWHDSKLEIHILNENSHTHDWIFTLYFLLPNDYNVEIWYWSAFPYNSKFTLTSKIAWNKHRRYKEG